MSCFLRNSGNSVRWILRSRDVLILLAIILLPIAMAFVLLHICSWIYLKLDNLLLPEFGHNEY